MRRGYHSTQRKYFNTMPRSAFLGLVLGYAIGLFLTGLFDLDSYILQFVGIIIGIAIGYWIDDKYFAEKDVPVEEIEEAIEKVEKADEMDDGLSE
ncbi:MAG: hypothetical protein Q4P20_10820 [Eubacteriales bacterium]|nr:hypothetical protein [Eubacteriales bacterium]